MITILGRVLRFGDNVDTDIITPAYTLQMPIEEIRKHAFEPVIPEFYKKVRDGDVIVAGKNFGCGSSREHATAVLKALGIKFVICDSMARIYFRNCIALGVYPVLAKNVSNIFDDGNRIEINTEYKILKNLTKNTEISFIPLSNTPLLIVDAGGILPLLKKTFCDDMREP